MPRNVLIAGTDNLLGTHLSALCIAERDFVFYATRPSDQICGAQLKAFVAKLLDSNREGAHAGTAQKQVKDRMHVCPVDDLHSGAWPTPIDEIWYLGGGNCFKAPVRREEMEWHRLGRLMSHRTAAALGSLNVVWPIAAEQKQDRKSVRSVVSKIVGGSACEKISLRFFRTAEIIGESPSSLDGEATSFVHFLSVLHDLQCEIQERQPQYFAFHALRSRAARDRGINLIHARPAAKLMLRIARRNDTSGSEYAIGAAADTPIDRFYMRISRAYGLNLLPAGDGDALSAIDRAFEQRLSGYDPTFSASLELDWRLGREAGDMTAEELNCPTDEQDTALREIRNVQETARRHRLGSAAAMDSKLQKITIDRAGFELVYFVAGSQGSAVIVLNALGQPLRYWYRLIDILMQRHRVVLWEPRGTHAAASEFGILEQVEDAKAIMGNEGFTAARIIAWCTGAKVAIEFYRQWPHSVSSMVFLNATLKSVGTSQELETPYERNLESLCRAADAQPSLADRIQRTLKSGLEAGDLELLDDDIDQAAVDVLSSVNSDLKSCLLAPFRDEASTLSYARQVLNFFAHDSVADARRVQAPVLLITSEYDRVASPAMSRFTAGLLPRSQLIDVAGASHYCLYDRPRLIADLIETFWD